LAPLFSAMTFQEPTQFYETLRELTVTTKKGSEQFHIDISGHFHRILHNALSRTSVINRITNDFPCEGRNHYGKVHNGGCHGNQCVLYVLRRRVLCLRLRIEIHYDPMTGSLNFHLINVSKIRTTLE